MNQYLYSAAMWGAGFDDNRKQSRVLRVFNIPRSTDSLIFTDFCKTFGEVFAVNQTKVETLGYAYVAYYDLRSALKAFEGLPMMEGAYGCGNMGAGIRAEFVQTNEFQRVSLNSGLENLSLCNRSGVLILQNRHGHSSHASNSAILTSQVVCRAAAGFGDIQRIDAVTNGFLCQYFDIRACTNFLNSFRGHGLEGVPVRVFYADQLATTLSLGRNDDYGTKATTTATSTITSTSTSSRARVDTTSTAANSLNESMLKRISEKKSSLTEEGNVEDNLKNGSLDLDTKDSGSGLGVVTKANVARNNVVDLRRISKGLDTRTTLMLRNIPNKVDQQMLKDYIDVTNANTYDFLCEYIIAVPEGYPSLLLLTG